MSLYIRLIFAGIFLLVSTALFAANSEEPGAQIYAVNLMAMSSAINLKKVANRTEFSRGELFVTTEIVKKKFLNMLRVGPYMSKAEARKVAVAVKKYYSGAYVTKLSNTNAIKSGLIKVKPVKSVSSSNPSKISKSRESVKVTTSSGSSYAVNLMAMVGNINPKKYKHRSEYGEGKLFVTKARVNDKKMNLLRVGPYNSKAEAGRVALASRKYYKGAFVTKMGKKKGSPQAVKNATKINTPEAAARSTKEPAKPVLSSIPVPVLPQVKIQTSADKNPVSKADIETRLDKAAALKTPEQTVVLTAEQREKKKLEDIMDRARTALARNEVRKAVGFFDAILQQEQNEYSQEAQELLGLSRERLGQTAHAKKEYLLYLDLYPEGENANRVKQRLQVLLTADDDLPGSLSEAAGKQAVTEIDAWKVYGEVNQFYRQLSEEDSDLFSFATLTGRKRTDKWSIRSQFTASHTAPLQGDEDSELRLSELYVEVNQVGEYFALKLGRQRSNRGGVYTRFDGAAVTVFAIGEHSINLVMGAPVENSYDDFINENKQFYGVNVDSTFFGDTLDVNTYFVQQTVDSIVDRQAVGFQSAYFSEKFNLFSVLDYDVSYQDLNVFLLSGSWSSSDKTSYYFNFDHHNSPFLQTTNALQGQTVGTIEDLGLSLTEDEIFQLAEDHTAKTSLINAGIFYVLDGNTRMRGELSISSNDETVGSTNVVAIPSSTGDYSILFQLIEDNYPGTNGVSILQFQYSDSSTSKTFKAKLSAQIPFNGHWEIEPQGLITVHENEDNQSYNVLSAGLRAEYRYRKDFSLEIEFSGDLSNDSVAFEDEAIPNLYLALGYRWYF